MRKITPLAAALTTGLAFFGAFPAVAQTAPASYVVSAPLRQKGLNVLMSPTTSTVSVASIVFDNWFEQFNGATAGIFVGVAYNTGGGCTGNAGYKGIGRFQAKAGETREFNFPEPLVVKPNVAGQTACLVAALTIQGDPAYFYLPYVTLSGFVVSGASPFPAAASTKLTTAASRAEAAPTSAK